MKFPQLYITDEALCGFETTVWDFWGRWSESHQSYLLFAVITPYEICLIHDFLLIGALLRGFWASFEYISQVSA
jgi:hypothetical protein